MATTGNISHVHCLARSFYSGCDLSPDVIGSFLGLPVKNQASKDNFDFGDLYAAQTMLLRLGDTAFLTVFNDAGAAFSYLADRLSRVTAPLNELQLREVMVDAAYLNLRLKHRPRFRTEFDIEHETASIVADAGDFELGSGDLKVRGQLLHHAIRDALPSIKSLNQSDDAMHEAIEAGTFSFLWNEKGEFIDKEWVPLETTEPPEPLASDAPASASIPATKPDGSPM